MWVCVCVCTCACVCVCVCVHVHLCADPVFHVCSCRLWQRAGHHWPCGQEQRALHLWLCGHVPCCCPQVIHTPAYVFVHSLTMWTYPSKVGWPSFMEISFAFVFMFLCAFIHANMHSYSCVKCLDWWVWYERFWLVFYGTDLTKLPSSCSDGWVWWAVKPGGKAIVWSSLSAATVLFTAHGKCLSIVSHFLDSKEKKDCSTGMDIVCILKPDILSSFSPLYTFFHLHLSFPASLPPSLSRLP